MIAAAIDIGTNSVLLLVAEPVEGRGLRVLAEAEHITRLGRKLHETGMLQPAAIQETVAAVQKFAQKARQRGAQRVVVAATSAVREAVNGRIIAEEVQRTTGLGLRVLSGAEEARTTFVGVASDPALAHQALCVVDAGGGSTELIRGHDGRIASLTSIDIGCVRLTERFLATDPPRQEDVAQLMEHVREELRKSGVRRHLPGEILVGVGGTITTLAAIDQGLPRYQDECIDGYVLRLERVQALREWLQRLRLSERAKVVGLPPRRAPVIVAGSALFETLMAELNFAQLRVSTRGLRHGLLLLQDDANG